LKLQEAAASLEQTLQSKSVHTPSQLEKIEKYLQDALKEFEPLLDEPKKQKAVGTDDIAKIFAELKPLLESCDFGVSDYAEKLQGIVGMEELAERINEYDFDGALKILNSSGVIV
jgi:hypothetical protein